MAELTDTAEGRPRRFRRLLLIAAGLLAVGALAVALLPRALSTPWFRDWVAARAADALGRPVRLEALRLRWPGELVLEGVTIPDDPAFSSDPLLTLHRLRLAVAPGKLLRGRLAADLEVDGLALEVVRDEQGRTNLEALLGTRESPAGPEPAAGGRGLPLVPDRVHVHAEGVTVRATDRLRGRSAALTDLALDLDLPALDRPVRLEVRADLAVDGRALPPVRVDARAERLLTPDGRPNPGGAAVDADADLPGIALSAHADLASSEAEARVRIDLARLLDAVDPFLPPDAPVTEARGAVEIRFDGSGDPGGPLAFELAVDAADLVASGPALGGGRVGPVALSVRGRGTADPAAGRAAVAEGELRVGRGSRLAWAGTVSGLASGAPAFDAELGPADLDLAELRALVEPFLPAVRDVRFGEGASLALARVHVVTSSSKGGGTDPEQSVSLQGLALRLPDLAWGGASPGEARDLELTVAGLEAELRAGFPARLRVDGELACGRFAGFGGVTAEGVRRVGFDLDLPRLARTEGAPGVSGRGTAKTAADLAALAIPGLGRVRGLRHEAEVAVSLAENGAVEASLDSWRLSARELEGTLGGTALHLGGSPGPVRLEVGSARAAGRLPAPGLPGEAPVEVRGLAVALPGLSARTPASEVHGTGVALEVPELRASLQDGFPARVALRAALRVDEVSVAGGRAVRASGLSLPALSLELTDGRPAPGALLGAAGRLRVEAPLAAAAVELTGMAELREVKETLRARCTLPPEDRVDLALEELGLAAGTARIALPRGEVATGVDLRLAAEGATLHGRSGRVDLRGARAHLRLGDVLEADLRADLADSGAGSARADGAMHLDLAALARAVPPEVLRGARLVGTAGLSWAAEGRVPTAVELAALGAAPVRLASPEALSFLKHLELSTTLDRVGADLPLGPGRLDVAGVTTEAPLAVRLDEGAREASVSGRLAVGWVAELPGLGTLAEPQRAAVSVQAERSGPRVRVSDRLELPDAGLHQEIDATVSGLDRLLTRGLDTPPTLWLTLLDGEAHASLAVGPKTDVGSLGRKGDPFAGDLVLAGPLEAGARVRLVHGVDLAVGSWLRADGARVGLGGLADVQGLRSDLRVEKRFRLTPAEETAGERRPLLTEQVLEADGQPAGAGPAPAGDLRFGGVSTVGCDVARVDGLPLPLEVRDLDLRIGIPGGIPRVDRFAAGLLGGAVAGAAAVTRRPGGFGIDGRVAFTGLDAGRLAGEPPTAGAAAEREASGRVALVAPLVTEVGPLLDGLELDLDLTRVGRETLDRALYALDPSGSDEAIVQQRRLVRLGRPRRVRVAVRDGNLSLEGEVEAGGVRLALPRLERFNLAGVPGLEPLGDALTRLRPVLTALEAASAAAIEIDRAGAVRFRQEDVP